MTYFFIAELEFTLDTTLVFFLTMLLFPFLMVVMEHFTNHNNN